MKFQVVLDPNSYPDIVGELLRDQFFESKLGYGCYSTFVTRSDVIQLPDEDIDPDPDDYYIDNEIHYKVFEKTIDDSQVIMKYYWDGDGTLEFHFSDGSSLYNDDCKKANNWEYFNAKEINRW